MLLMVTDFIKERIQEVKFAHTVEKLGTLLKEEMEKKQIRLCKQHLRKIGVKLRRNSG